MINLSLIRIVMVHTHVVAGFISLITFWLIIFLPKKTSAHLQIGRLYLLAIILIMITTIINDMILRTVVHFTYDSKIIFDTLTFTFFSFTGLLTYASTHIPIWVMSKKAELTQLQNSNVLNFFLFFTMAILAAGLLVGFFYFPSSPLLAINGFLLAPYILIPLVNALWKIKRAKTLNFDIIKFHINALIRGGIILHASFIAGGANLRYFKREFSGSYLLGLTLALAIIFSLMNEKMICAFKKNL